jgi:hypothetical protein
MAVDISNDFYGVLKLLLLLPLLLLQFVLLVGTVGLAVYAATQVFGWNAVLLGQRGAFSDGEHLLGILCWHFTIHYLLFWLDISTSRGCVAVSSNAHTVLEQVAVRIVADCIEGLRAFP